MVDLEDIAKGTSIAVRGGAAITGTVFLAAASGALLGGLAGQMCDWIPYINHAIPEGIAYIGNAFTEQDTVKQATEYLQGNLDKVGAAAGFIGRYFKASLSYKKSEIT